MRVRRFTHSAEHDPARTTAARAAPASPGNDWAPSPLRRLLRRPGVQWGAAAILALTAGAIVADTTAEAARLRAGFGTTREVLVTEGSVASGAPLAAAVTRRSLPEAALPVDALETVDPAATATGPISEGTVLSRQHIAGAEALGAGDAAVALAAGPTVPPAPPGTAVWIVVGADPFAGLESTLVAGRVLATTTEAITVIVSIDDLATVSAANNAGVAGLALRGG